MTANKDWIGRVSATVFAMYWIFMSAFFIALIYKMNTLSYFFAGSFFTTGVVMAILIVVDNKVREEETDEIYLLYDIKEEIEKIKRKLMEKGGR